MKRDCVFCRWVCLRSVLFTARSGATTETPSGSPRRSRTVKALRYQGVTPLSTSYGESHQEENNDG